MYRRTVRSMVLGVAVAVSTWSLASVAGAQLGRARVSNAEPNYWVGLSIAYVDGMSMSDNASNSSWNFGSSTQIRATLEKKLDAGVTGGFAAGFSTAPLTYTPATITPAVVAVSGACLTGCQAKADVTQYVLFIRGGGGPGFHAMYNVEGGVTQFSNFREDGTSGQLPPEKGRYDVTFGLGYGFAYGMSTNADAYVGQSWNFILHKQLSTTTTSAPRVSMYRAGLRFGF
jgi:hypothetical protein